jgi:hypothetical protein
LLNIPNRDPDMVESESVHSSSYRHLRFFGARRIPIPKLAARDALPLPGGYFDVPDPDEPAAA